MMVKPLTCILAGSCEWIISELAIEQLAPGRHVEIPLSPTWPEAATRLQALSHLGEPVELR